MSSTSASSGSHTEWVRLKDERQRVFYYNLKTATSTWIQPATFQEPTPRSLRSIMAKGVVPPEASEPGKIKPKQQLTLGTKRSQKDKRGGNDSDNSSPRSDASGGSKSRSLGVLKVVQNLAKQMSHLTTGSSSSPKANSEKKKENSASSAALLEARRHWGRPDRARTEDFGFDDNQGEETYRFRTSSSADLIQLLQMTRDQYHQQQQRTSRLVPPAKREVKEREKERREMIRPPSFLEMDVRTANRFKEVSSKLKNSTSLASSSVDDGAAGKYRPRRNTTNSIMVDNLMSKPDVMFQIKVISWVLHAHMIRFALNRKKNKVPMKQQARFDVFNEDFGKEEKKNLPAIQEEAEKKEKLKSVHTAGGLERQLLTRNASNNQLKRSDSKVDVFEQSAGQKVPDKDTISGFISQIYNKSQMEKECILMVLIYVERLLEATKGALELNMRNWQPIVFSCMILASKVWDDLSMWNADFSLISGGGYNVKRVNELEVALLECMQYNVRVPASTYAKYYFQLRSLKKSYLKEVGGDGRSDLDELSMGKASKMELLSERYYDTLGIGWEGPNKPKELVKEEKKKEKKDKNKPVLKYDVKEGGVRKRANTIMEGSSREVMESMHKEGPKFMGVVSPNASLEQVVHSGYKGAMSQDLFL